VYSAHRTALRIAEAELEAMRSRPDGALAARREEAAVRLAEREAASAREAERVTRVRQLEEALELQRLEILELRSEKRRDETIEKATGDAEKVLLICLYF